MSGLTQAKAARMEKAAKLKFGKDMTHKQIGEKLGLSKNTIDNYFAQEEMKNFQRIFSDKEKFELQRVLEQQLYDISNEAEEKIRAGANHPEASAADRIRAGKELVNTLEKKVKIMQEMGIIKKPKERKEVRQKNVDSSSDKLSELYKEKMSEEESEEVEKVAAE